MTNPGEAETNPEPDQLKRLKKARGAHRGAATKLINDSSQILDVPFGDLTEEQVEHLAQFSESLKKKLLEINKRNEAIEELIPDEQLDTEVAEATDNIAVIEAHIRKMDKIVTLKSQPSISSQPAINHNVHAAAHPSPAVNMKLPKMDLPTFSGSYTEWTSFNDLFTASVHNNQTLSNSQKLHYLKTSLTGDAAKIIRSVQITDDNYQVALDLLMDRFDNERCIVSAHIQAIIACPHAKSGTAQAVRHLQQTVDEHRRALETKGVSGDAYLLHIVTEKLDPESRRLWEHESAGKKLQTYPQFKKFLDQRCQALEAAPQMDKPAAQTNGKQFNQQKLSPKVHAYQTNVASCQKCQGPHKLYKCSQFVSMDVSERAELVKNANLCFNCFMPGHTQRECKSTYKCRTCHKPHHSLLHREDVGAMTTSVAGYHGHNPSSVLLATCIVPVSTQRAGTIYCRALLDCASQGSFISEACAQRIGAKREYCNTEVTGIGGESGSQARGLVKLRLQGIDTSLNVSAMILPRISRLLPTSTFNIGSWEHIKSVTLADPNFNIPGDIDILLGGEVYDSIVKTGKLSATNGIYLKETIFGWVVSGQANARQPTAKCHSMLSVNDDSLLKRFWELEEVPQANKLTPEEISCEEHFVRTTRRDVTGRYVVKLPFKPDAGQLGESRQQALRRYLSLEQRLERDPATKKKYVAFIQEFKDLGHLKKVPQKDMKKPNEEVYYLPHHHVVKESSTTTKLRVVFDGSAKSASGKSLNDLLMVGAKTQDDLTDHLLRFRMHRVAMTADIAKMYRQVSLDEPDRDYHRILWRDSPQDPIQDLRMTVVTYGVASSCFHSTRTIRQVFEDEYDPAASPVIQRDLYVDDGLTGAEDVERSRHLQTRIRDNLKRGGFDLRKWSSNHPELVLGLPSELQESGRAYEIQDETHVVKTLGVEWKPITDVFTFTVTDYNVSNPTKRNLLSDISKFFDPVGWAAPVVIRFKILMQRCWVEGLSWDETLKPELQEIWNEMCSDLSNMSAIALPRCVLAPGDTHRIELHVFCDASEAAYAAAIFIVVKDSNSVTSSRLLIAKTRVAPVKTVCLPRLELCAAHLGTKLLLAVRQALVKLDLTIDEVYGWTDSTIVLSWLAALPRRWTTFVCNRVADIQSGIPPSQWKHVPSQDNPADCASRGLSAEELKEFKLWWDGPEWLINPEKWPESPVSLPEAPERRKAAVNAFHVTAPPDFPIDIEKYSSLPKLKRIVAYLIRPSENRSLPKESKKMGYPDPAECLAAFYKLVSNAQQHQFADIFHLLQAGTKMPENHRFKALSPFYDEHTQCVHVGGRLSQSDYSFQIKHPVLLEKSGHLVELIIRQAHLETMHGGVQATLYQVRQTTWLVNARDKVRKVIHGCVTCVRFNKIKKPPLMGDLPEERVTLERPFFKTGVDYGGPISLRLGSTRSKQKVKSYIALFVCFARKAVHIELVTDLSTNACIAALKRFISRRGTPATIYSDNGTNFVGASNEIHKLLMDSQAQKELRIFAAQEQTQWIMIPPHSPHFGGLWEAGIKSVKQHLRKIVGSHLLNYEEMATVLTQIEAVLNSRPLTAISNDPNDLQALTPAHFLTGKSLVSPPNFAKETTNVHQLKRWQLTQELYIQFWTRWHKEYLTSLQPKSKWTKETENLKIGDMVLIMEDNLAPLQWPLARVKKVYLGNDGVARVVQVATAKGTYNRPVVKLKLLPTAASLQ